ncbi:solute carrier family 2, facilitated glucose transporter member 8-like [Dermacentor variabilis]|uniref:solute carrier family 2, facilitated glucose transporter member 8-like n=1 Tax=Dermacentor variabilis TaxID=34621 RepID=UPI003F5CA22A
MSSEQQPGQKAIEALRNWQPSVRGGTPVTGETVTEMTTTGHHVVCALVACLGSCAAGTTLGYASAAMPSIEHESWYGAHNNTQESRWFADLLLLVAAPGALAAGFLLEMVGNRLMLLLCAFGLLGSWLSLLCSSSTKAMFVARFMAGVFLGATSSSAGVHVAEICPSERRAFFLGFVEVARYTGMLLAYVLGHLFTWEIQAGLCMLPPLVLVCLQRYVLDSPQWLLRHGKRTEALAALSRLYGLDIPIEFRIRSAEELAKAKSSATTSKCARCMALALLLQLLPELSGVRLLLQRGDQVMLSLMAETEPWDSVGVLLVAGHVALSGLFASLTRVAGRRHLLLLSAVITAICMITLSPLQHLVFRFLPLISYSEKFHWTVEDRPRLTNWNGIYAVGILLASHSLGLGHVPALLASELLPARVRCVGAASSWAGRWLLAFLLAHQDAWLSEVASSSHGLVPGLVLVFGAAIAAIVTPETEGRTLLAIEGGV